MISKRDYRDYLNLEKVTLPIDSVGECKNWRNCKNYKVQLGNGFCVNCYDKGLERQSKSNTSFNPTSNQQEQGGTIRYGTTAVGHL